MSSSGSGGTKDVGSYNHVVLLWVCSTGQQKEKTALSD